MTAEKRGGAGVKWEVIVQEECRGEGMVCGVCNCIRLEILPKGGMAQMGRRELRRRER